MRLDVGSLLLVLLFSAHGHAQPAQPRDRGAVVSQSLLPYLAGTRGQIAFWERDWEGAVKHLERWLAQNGRHPDAPRARLLLGTSLLYSGRPKAAARRLEGLIGKLGGLDDYVRFLAAKAWLRAGDRHQARRRVPTETTIGPLKRSASLLAARAGKRAWQSHLAAWPDAAPNVHARVADELLRRGKKKAGAAALRQVIARAPLTDKARRAQRKLERLPRKLRRMTRAELQIRMRALYDRHHHKHTIKTAKKVQARTRPGTEAWCEAGFSRARALERWKKRAQALPIYELIVRKCVPAKAVSTDRKADILYYGAKRQMNGGSDETAMAWFDRVRKVAPDHSYGDDTLVWQAFILRGKGKNAAADALLEKVIEGDGDMQEKAAFELVWHHYEAGRYPRAAVIARKAVQSVSAGQQLKSRGRLAYWLGRSFERAGNRVRAAMAYARVIRDYPLGWYSQLALQRLQSIDPKAAADAVAESREVRPSKSIATANAAILKRPDVARAVELLRLGLRRMARAEIADLRRARADPGVDWLLALLHSRAGDDVQAYRIARWRRPEYQRTWPASGHEERWHLAYPRPSLLSPLVRAAARQNGIEEALVWAVIRTESGFVPDAVSIANAFGLMQLILPTGRAMARQEGIRGAVGRAQLTNPAINIRLGSRYLGKLSARFEKHPALMAAGYNAGPGGPMKWLRQRGDQELDEFVENIPYQETRRYTRSVVTSWLRYRTLYGGRSAANVALRLPTVE